MANQYQQLGIMVTDNGRVRITDGTGPLGMDMPLAGARAEINDIQKGHSIAPSVPFIGLIHTSMKATVTVTFANGVVHRKQIVGKLLVRNAKQEVLQFNQQVMAAAASGEPMPG